MKLAIITLFLIGLALLASIKSDIDAVCGDDTACHVQMESPQ